MTKKKTRKKIAASKPKEQPSGIEVILDFLLKLIGKGGKWAFITILVLALLVLGVGAYLLNRVSENSATTEVDQRIDVTPTQITAMKQIGQWEFLSVSDEELVDTLRPGFFSDDELIRIYYGTMRLGIDMSDANESWISHDNDTIEVTLPPIRLLDDRFIDEARTKSFFESGSWSDADREAMYQRARQRMMARGLSKSNMESAEQNASRQFYQMMRSMGFEHVKVRFAQTPQERKKQ